MQWMVQSIKLADKEPFAMFNPRIISTGSEFQSGSEGCLSFPELWIDVKRPATITVEYFDKLGIQCILTLTGLDARCFLHELDHLNGVCFTDIVSPLKLAMAKKKQQKRKRNG
jgi:peptide deformylase